jgi:hypothetical protein
VHSSMSRAPWREHRHGARCAGGGVARAAASRERIVESLVAARVLWPLVDHGPSCCSCAAPRRPPLGDVLVNCRSCVELTELYEGGLADLYPISYTTPDGALCAAVRELKDRFGARSDNRLARDIGAILSAYLQAQLGGGRLGHRRFDVVTAVPSSRPVVAAALQRAGDEGWWSCELGAVATARRGHRRQRERPDRLRKYVHDKWDVDHAAVNGLDVLVVDDLYTSGGSVHSFAHALRQAGAASVRAVVLARNLWAHDAAWVLSLLRTRHDAGHGWVPSTNKYDVIGPGTARFGDQAGADACLSRCVAGSRGRA